MKIIRDHCAKLVLLSGTMEAWSRGPYGKILCMLNDETLQMLHHFCMKYTNAFPNFDFKPALEQIFHDLYSPHTVRKNGSIPPFCRSFGMTAILSSDVASHYLAQFWKTGVSDPQDIPNDPIWNPFFSRSDKFDIHSRTTPLAIYHFSTLTSNIEEGVRNTIVSAKAQFKAWCDAFRKAIDRIIIKFVVSDPLAVCFALAPAQYHSSPWNGLNLESSLFNAIDMSYLVDHLGGVNALIATVPLLHPSPSATIHMESTNRPWSEETTLLRYLLCGEALIMCNILGVTPIAYLTKATTCGVLQDLPIIYDFSGQRPAPGVSRIVWKIPPLGDSSVTKPLKLAFDSDDLLKLLCGIYDEMFTPSQTIPPMYTNSSFAALLAFMKRRVLAEWSTVIPALIDALISHPDRDYSPDLQIQFHLFGVSSFPPNVCREDPVQRDAQLSRIIFSVPRRCLGPIYEKSSNTISAFQLRLHDSSSYEAYSFIPIFGRRSELQLEKDVDGWFGSSDLHLCLYVATDAFSERLSETSISFHMSNQETIRRHQDNTEGIFRSNLFDTNHVQICSAPSISHFAEIPVHEFENSVATISVKDMKLMFTTRIAVDALTTETTITATQTSPCVMLMQCGSDHICQFPYPIEGQKSTVRVARKSGWIEVCVPLSAPNHGLSPKHLDGGYSTACFPLTRGIGMDMCSWNLPLINFPRLHTFEHDDVLSLHIVHIFSDLELKDTEKGQDCPLVIFKRTVANIFKTFIMNKTRVFGLQHSGTIRYLIFVRGLCSDPSSHSVVAEAYVFQTTEESRASRLTKRDDEKFQIMSYDVDSDGLKVWMSSLPAMIERCRDWEHKDSCEYSKGNYSQFCSCGVGRAAPEFFDIKEWTEFAPNVIRFALSPIFPAPFVEQIRHQALEQFDIVNKKVRADVVGTKGCATCCRTGHTKKCGNCGKVYYCGEICQRKHWKLHKPECRKD